MNIITAKYNNYLWFILAFNGILNWTISIIADYNLFRSRISEYKQIKTLIFYTKYIDRHNTFVIILR
ncbi:hypothetical protein [Brachyspira hyodysenteriae]|nr:hypothetical protein [Brachyspira hyodysenteriae]MCZ9985838.1 hypothetical protein [Brachyspira hyodysenteriae]